MSMNEQTRAFLCPNYLAAFDHRDSFTRMLTKLGVSSDPPCVNGLKQIIWKGVKAALPQVREHTATGVLIDRNHLHIASEAQDAGVGVALALERSGGGPLQPDGPLDNLHQDLSSLQGALGKILIRWDNDLPSSGRRRDLATLRALRDVVAAANAELLLELLITPASRPTADTIKLRAWEHEILPRLQYNAMAEIIDEDIVPAAWKIEGHQNSGAGSDVARLAGSARPDSSLLILGGGHPIPELQRVFSCRSGSERFCGFAVGRTIWSGPIGAVCRTEITAASAQRIVSDNFLVVIDAFEAANGSPERSC